MNSMNIDVCTIAKYFISLSGPKTKNAITHLKLQKLIYYAQAHSIAVFKQTLFDEEIQAWNHGPVCPVLYDKYKINKHFEIRSEPFNGELSNNVKILLDAIWKNYGSYTGKELERMTRLEQPWIEAMKKGKNTIISVKNMQKYFS